MAEVVRRGDSVGKWDMNDLCGIRGLVGRGGVLFGRWGMAFLVENKKYLENRWKSAGVGRKRGREQNRDRFALIGLEKEF